MNDTSQPSTAAAFAMRLSLWTGFVMLVAKVGAYLLTGSAAILGDAAESVVERMLGKGASVPQAAYGGQKTSGRSF